MIFVIRNAHDALRCVVQLLTMDHDTLVFLDMWGRPAMTRFIENPRPGKRLYEWFSAHMALRLIMLHYPELREEDISCLDYKRQEWHLWIEAEEWEKWLDKDDQHIRRDMALRNRDECLLMLDVLYAK